MTSQRHCRAAAVSRAFARVPFVRALASTITIALVVPGALPSAEPPLPEAVRPGAESIALVDLQAWVGFLAAPELEGRRSGERGYDIAARFCAAILQQHGILPAGDAVDGKRSYFQRFDLLREEPDAEASSLVLSDGAAERAFAYGADFAAGARHAIAWDALPVVFVGSATAPHEAAADLGLGDRIALAFAGSGRNAFDRGRMTKIGARRILLVGDPAAESRRFRSGDRLESQFRPAAPPEDGIEALTVSEAFADILLARLGTSVAAARALEKDDKPLPPAAAIDGITVRVARPVRVRRRPTVNVIGKLEGSDAALRKTHVVVGAHLDHVGVEGESIFYGADDDASGSAGVLAIAKAFATSPRKPRRSILFCLYGAEELGLLGSRFLVENPPVPIDGGDGVVAKFQLDMIGRDEENEQSNEKAEDNRNSVNVVGSRRRSFELDGLIGRLNASIGLELEYDEERVFMRSDQANFASRGIPVAFFFTGFHRDYHRATDTIDKLNFDKMLRIVRLTYAAAHSVADMTRRLRVFERF